MVCVAGGTRSSALVCAVLYRWSLCLPSALQSVFATHGPVVTPTLNNSDLVTLGCSYVCCHRSSSHNNASRLLYNHLHQQPGDFISVHLYCWSSQHHHHCCTALRLCHCRFRAYAVTITAAVPVPVICAYRHETSNNTINDTINGYVECRGYVAHENKLHTSSLSLSLHSACGIYALFVAA